MIFVFKHLLTVVFAGLIILLVVASARALYAKTAVRGEINSLKEEIEEMEKANRELASLVEMFNDEEVVELEAKKRLNLKKAGEEVAVIVRDKNDESQNIVQKKETAAEDNIKQDKEPSNPIKWWAYITSDKK